MIFDQYSRYKACSDLLQQAGLVSGNTVLDIGSGPECLFGQFMQDAKMSYVDPLIQNGSGSGRITGDVFAGELDKQTFDCVSAVDVLEHVPPEHRQAFLERMSSLGKNTLILGFPTSDSSDAFETDKAIDEQYRVIFGHDYSWLEEHYRFGLPSLAETVGQLSQLGWHCRTVGHGHAPWLRELLGFVVCVWDIPSMSNVVLEISEKFNRELYAYDFRPPYYRQFVIASRSPLPPISAPAISNNFEAADSAFRTLMEDALRRYFAASLKQLVERDTQIVLLNQKIEEASAWGTAQQATLVKRDAQIDALNQKIEKLSEWSTTQQATMDERDPLVATQHEKIVALERALSDKQAELLKMSGWVQSMMLEHNRCNASVASHAENVAKRVKALVRKKLAQSFLGDMVRHARDSRRCREKRVSLEAIRQSVLDNRGRLIIAFPIITWDFRWQRPQHIVSRLRDRGFSVWYVAMSLSPLGRRLRSSKDAVARIDCNELAPHVNQVWLSSSRQLNIYTDPIEGDDLFNISMGLEALVSELRPQSIVYLVQFPGWGPVALDVQKKLGGKVIFDCMDDHGGFSTNTAQALKTEEVLVKNADLVITSSNLLEERAKLINPSTIQIKNGTEFEHFMNPIRNGQLDCFCDHPIIGYYGAISDWFDMELVAHCASQRPDWNFVLIGATTGADLQPVAGLGNVHFLGEKPYKDLPGYLAYFDVCTIPFKIIPLTLATNPVKFYEYLSAGKPVVSVDLPELIAYQEDCYLAHNPDEFLAQLERAYNEREDGKKIERRLKLASENSWDARVSAILESEIFKTSLYTNPKIMNKPGTLTFKCNICGSMCEAPAAALSREEISCKSCGSTVRMRGMMHALSIALFGRALTLPEFPERKDIIGKGMSDWDGYAKPLSKKLGYTNTYYHKAPKLDITNISADDEQSVDFLLSTDVFEHVAPPVSIAFENARKMLKPGGAFVLSVPYGLQGETQEHFPNLHEFKLESRNGERILINRTRDGNIEEFSDLVFHGGEGETIEMRVFSESGLLKDLQQAGFNDVQIMKDPYFEFGIYWPSPWSLPIIARVKPIPAKVSDWGPKSMSVGSVVNPQPGGRSAIWLKVAYVRPGVNLELRIGEHVADGLVVTDGLITGLIPIAALKTQGTQPVSIADANTGGSVHVGFLTVAG